MNTPAQHKKANKINNDTAQESRTFLRWLNAKLKSSTKQTVVANFQTDLSDGMILVELVEILSGKKVGNKYTKINSKLHQHHLDRITFVLDHMSSNGIEMFTKIGETI